MLRERPTRAHSSTCMCVNFLSCSVKVHHEASAPSRSIDTGGNVAVAKKATVRKTVVKKAAVKKAPAKKAAVKKAPAKKAPVKKAAAKKS